MARTRRRQAGLLDIAKGLVRGGERREAAVAALLAPDNLFQPFTTTEPDRYPDEFSVLAGLLPAAPRLLSFGCSSGEELLSLHRYFPDAAIRGVDINPLAVRHARRRVRAAGLTDLVDVVRAGDVAAERPGSYDAVLALAVFRHGSLKTMPERCDHLLRFADFERTVTGLAGAVRPGGLLVIRHANFRFTDTAAASDFVPVRVGYDSRNADRSTPVYGPDDRLVGDGVDHRDDGVYRRRNGAD